MYELFNLFLGIFAVIINCKYLRRIKTIVTRRFHFLSQHLIVYYLSYPRCYVAIFGNNLSRVIILEKYIFNEIDNFSDTI